MFLCLLFIAATTAAADAHAEDLTPLEVTTGWSSTWGYIDRSGRWVIPPQFNRADLFSEGLARVQVHGKDGFIDLAGRLVIAPQFDLAGHFAEGLAPVMLGRKWGYIDPTGYRVIKPQFDWPGTFSDGRACVELLHRDWDKATQGPEPPIWFYIDRDGRRLASPGRRCP